jgi:hypothetical protein
LALFVQYTYLSSLCWLNCISHSIWKSFRRVRRNPDNEPTRKALRNPQLRRYAIWAFGFPAAISTVTAAAQAMPEFIAAEFVRPEIGINGRVSVCGLFKCNLYYQELRRNTRLLSIPSPISSLT